MTGNRPSNISSRVTVPNEEFIKLMSKRFMYNKSATLCKLLDNAEFLYRNGFDIFDEKVVKNIIRSDQ